MSEIAANASEHAPATIAAAKQINIAHGGPGLIGLTLMGAANDWVAMYP